MDISILYHIEIIVNEYIDNSWSSKMEEETN